MLKTWLTLNTNKERLVILTLLKISKHTNIQFDKIIDIIANSKK